MESLWITYSKLSINPINVETFHLNPINPRVAPDEKSWDHEVIKIHPLGTMNVKIKNRPIVVEISQSAPKWPTDRSSDQPMSLS